MFRYQIEHGLSTALALKALVSIKEWPSSRFRSGDGALVCIVEGCAGSNCSSDLPLPRRAIANPRFRNAIASVRAKICVPLGKAPDGSIDSI